MADVSLFSLPLTTGEPLVYIQTRSFRETSKSCPVICVVILLFWSTPINVCQYQCFLVVVVVGYLAYVPQFRYGSIELSAVLSHLVCIFKSC